MSKLRQELTKQAAKQLLFNLPRNLGRLVLLDRWVRPVSLALRAQEAWPESGAQPVPQDMWELLEQMGRMEYLVPKAFQELRALLVRLDLTALPGETGMSERLGRKESKEQRVRLGLRGVRAPLDQPVPQASPDHPAPRDPPIRPGPQDPKAVRESRPPPQTSTL